MIIDNTPDVKYRVKKGLAELLQKSPVLPAMLAVRREVAAVWRCKPPLLDLRVDFWSA